MILCAVYFKTISLINEKHFLGGFCLSVPYFHGSPYTINFRSYIKVSAKVTNLMQQKSKLVP